MICPANIIRGLRYSPSYVGADEANGLLAIIDKNNWIRDLARRVQHYGYRYDYGQRLIQFLGQLPDWALDLAERFVRDGFATEVPNQLIVNEYHPGQGITRHIDCVPCFGPTILCLSLGSTCVMNFTQADSPTSVPLLLEPESLLILEGDARYQWRHDIPAHKTDLIQGKRIFRRRRVSLTFRTVLEQQS